MHQLIRSAFYERKVLGMSLIERKVSTIAFKALIDRNVNECLFDLDDGSRQQEMC